MSPQNTASDSKVKGVLGEATIAGEHVMPKYRGGEKDYVLFGGLLDAAHQVGLRSIESDLVQIPGPDNGNVAVTKAVVTFARAVGRDTPGGVEEGEELLVFTAYGDAKVGEKGVGGTAPIRMSETRAKARALRDGLNVKAAVDDTDEGPGEAPQGRQGGRDAGQGTGGRGVTREPAGGNVQALRGGAAQAPGAGEGKREGRSAPALKSQVDLLRTLAVEWAGEGGVERLEGRLGKPVDGLTRAEADEWIDRLTPEGRAN